MASFFEPDTFLLDPTSYDEPPSSFLSFSSFSALSHAATSPFDFASWDHGLASQLKGKKREPEHISSLPTAQPPSDTTLSDTSSPRDPFAIVEAAFEPSGPVGIFVETVPQTKLADGNPSSSHSYRSSTSSTETWDEPITPGLSNRSSIESFASTSTIHPGAFKQPSQPYSWDDASTGLGTASNYVHPPHRTTSNPVLNRNQPRLPRTIASMPSLKEEESSTPSAWFDGTEQIDTAALIASTGSAPCLAQQPNDGASSLQASNDLVDDFDWVFGDYGLGSVDIPPESTIFAAFQVDESSAGQSSTDNNQDPIDPFTVQSQQQLNPQSWLPTPAVQDTAEFSTYDYSAIANLPSFTIDPMTLMGPPMGLDDEPSRPSSAPGFNGGEGAGHMLSVPLADAMTRSVSSDGLIHRQAPARDLFSYAPQPIPAGPPAPQPLYTTDPSPSYINYPRSMPLTPSHTRRASSHGLSVQIQPLQYSTYDPSALPPTPQSATFGEFAHQQAHPQPIQMTRAGTQPLPTTRRLSTSEPSQSSTSKMPAHLVRAQAIVQMQEAKEEAQRQEMRRLSASRRVGMAQASVMQPQYQQPQHYHPQPVPQYQHVHPPSQRQTIMGWEGPSAQTASLPVLTTTPLVTIHPPPNQYVIHQGKGATTPHKVHPPPHPGTTNRPMAKMPVSPSRQRKVSASPNKRSPAAKKRQAQNAGGGFQWGETTFINFTSDDAEKLLTGVAPSGSQGKRKREEGMMMGEDGIEMVRDRSKRSRSDDQL